MSVDPPLEGVWADPETAQPPAEVISSIMSEEMRQQICRNVSAIRAQRPKSQETDQPHAKVMSSALSEEVHHIICRDVPLINTQMAKTQAITKLIVPELRSAPCLIKTRIAFPPF